MPAAQGMPEGTRDPSKKELKTVIRAMAFDLRLGKQNFAVGVCMVFLVSLTLSLLERSKRTETKVEEQARCRELSQLLQKKTLSEIINFHPTDSEKEKILMINKWRLRTIDRTIMAHLLLAQGCPWKPDATAVAQYRAQLEQCCNASFWLVATKENTPLGSYIISDGDKNHKLQVTTELSDLLPESSPFLDAPYRNCAVVGNGGILLNSSCGQEIDQADLVVRFNLPPMNFSKDVGTKTSVVTINPSILKDKFQLLLARRKPFAEALHSYRDAFFLLPTFSFVGHSTLGYRALYTMEDFGMMQQALFLNPEYLRNLGNFWKRTGLRARRLSSGFMLVSMALELCQRITLYGFWPFSYDLDNQPIPHHYYDNIWPKPGVHAMPAEFSNYLNMYAQDSCRFQFLLARCKPFTETLHSYRDTLFLLPTFSFVGHRTLGYRVLYTMEDFGMMQQALFLNSEYLKMCVRFPVDHETTIFAQKMSLEN